MDDVDYSFRIKFRLVLFSFLHFEFDDMQTRLGWKVKFVRFSFTFYRFFCFESDGIVNFGGIENECIQNANVYI